MIEVSVQFEKGKFDKIIAKAVLFGKDVNQAINRAAKRAADTGKAETKRQIVKRYTLPSSEIGNTIFSKYLDEGAVMQIKGYVNRLVDFKGTSPKSKPVYGKAKKEGSGGPIPPARLVTIDGKELLVAPKRTKTGFVQPGKIRELYGPSTVGMFKANEDVQNTVNAKIMETLDKRMIHELERLLNG